MNYGHLRSCFSLLREKKTGKAEFRFARNGFASEKNSAHLSKSCFGGHSETEGMKMRRSEKVEATLTPGEKETLQQLCDEAGCTEAELIRSVLISRSISLDDLETGKKTERVKNKTLHNCNCKRTQKKSDECGETIAEKRDVSFHVMLTASEKRRSSSVRRRLVSL